MKKTIKEIKALPSLVTYEHLPGSHWEGKSDGVIHEGLYLKVYPAYSCGWKYKTSYKRTSCINVPLNRVFTF